MKRFAMGLMAFLVVLFAALPAHAAEGAVTYNGDAGEFIFAPGSDHSLTDLFPNFKDVMPGDVLQQQITVKNEASKEVKVKIYIRALGAVDGSEEFLSQLGLTVQASANNTMAYMFDAMANETAQMTDWVCLGTLYSGGEVNLDVTLTVPVELGNEFQNAVGALEWEFMVEEYAISPDDPQPPATGEEKGPDLWILGSVVSLFAIVVLLVWHRKDRKKSENH